MHLDTLVALDRSRMGSRTVEQVAAKPVCLMSPVQALQLGPKSNITLDPAHGGKVDVALKSERQALPADLAIHPAAVDALGGAMGPAVRRPRIERGTFTSLTRTLPL